MAKGTIIAPRVERRYDRALLVQYARAVTQQHAAEFSVFFRLLDHPACERLWLASAWLITCHQLLSRDAFHQEGSDPAHQGAIIEALTERAMSGRATGNLAFDAFGMVAAETCLPIAIARDVMTGFAMASGAEALTCEADLLRHCYHTGGAVAVMIAIVLGTDPSDADLLDHVCALGMALRLECLADSATKEGPAAQLALSQEWFARAGVVTERASDPEAPPCAMAYFREQAQHYGMFARKGLSRLPFRRRWAVLSLARSGGRLAKSVRRAWPGGKLGLIAYGLRDALAKMPAKRVSVFSVPDLGAQGLA